MQLLALSLGVITAMLYLTAALVQLIAIRGQSAGHSEKQTEGSTQISAEGSPQNSADGSPQNSAEGSPQNSAEGSPQNFADGSPQNFADGSPQNSAEGSPQNFADGSPQNSAEGSMQVVMESGWGRRQTIKLVAAVAVMLHGLNSFLGINQAAGLDLGIYPMLSLISLVITTLLLLSSLRRPVDNLFVVLFPLAALTLLMEATLEGNPKTIFTADILLHATLSVIAASLLAIAAAQALLLMLGDKMLRRHDLALARILPPLEAMEQLMFELLWAGLIFMTLSILSGFIFLESFAVPGLVHHTAITLAAWVVFSILLWGRWRLGWRGAQASRWTLAGFGLLALGYFGSKLVVEIILGRV